MIFNYRSPIIMGILNVTPDSFSDGGDFSSIEKAFDKALKMIEEGAKIIDVGGESSRPGAQQISEEEELKRVLPIIQALSLLKNSSLDDRHLDFKISVDTTKPAVAKSALQLGADIINDITGMTNPGMRKVASEFKAPVIIMHMQGKPENMQENPSYENVIQEIKHFFEKQTEICEDEGIEEIILDPGIGFGKTLEQNLEIIKNLEEFQILGYPVLFGASRKSFIEKALNLPINQREEATQAVNVMALDRGASIFRVHEVKPNLRALSMAKAVLDV